MVSTMYAVGILVLLLATGVCSEHLQWVSRRYKQPGQHTSLLDIIRQLRTKADLDDIDTDTPGYISYNVNLYDQFRDILYYDDVMSNTDDTGYDTPYDVGYDTGYDIRSTLEGSDKVAEDVLDEPYVEKRFYKPEDAYSSAVSRYEMRKFPFYNVVKLSSGCTGTLLTPVHVLTAAHCVHTGTSFKNNMEMLKIEVPDKIGYRIHYIVKINVPAVWLKTKYLPEVTRGAYDYAVLELNLPVSGRHKFMQFALPTAKMLNSDLEYLGFYPDKSNGLWHSSCDTDENYIFMHNNVALRKCDSSSGNSGAAVYTVDAIDGPKIVGLLSNSISFSAGITYDDSSTYEAIMLLTPQKCFDICQMIAPHGENYHICESIRRNHVEKMQVATNRLMPFFG